MVAHKDLIRAKLTEESTKEQFSKFLLNNHLGAIHEKMIRNIGYADDNVIIAGSSKDFETVMVRIQTNSGKNRLSLDMRRTKFMKMST